MLLISDSQNQPVQSSKELIGQISQTTCLPAFALYRSNGCSSQPISGVYRDEHVVIGPVNHGYGWMALVKEHCTAMVSRECIPMPQHGSRNGGACRAWFSEPAKKKLDIKP